MAALAICVAAVFALFGFLSPHLDILNHLQPLIFAAAALSFLMVPMMERRGALRGIMFAVTGIGLLASLLVIVPEAVARFEEREPMPSDGRPVLKLMTHNVFALNYDMERLWAIILREDPDIIAFQEYFREQEELLGPLIEATYPYSVHCTGGKRANIALYSKLPFEQLQDEDCPDDIGWEVRTGHITAAFTLDDGTRFSVVTTHLDWPVPIERQLSQIEETAQIAAGAPGPAIVVGDMNSSAWSYALKRLEEEGRLERQTRNVMTFPARFYFDRWRDTRPVLPIDHVLTRSVEVHELHATEPSGSDHLPVVFTFSVSPAAQF